MTKQFFKTRKAQIDCMASMLVTVLRQEHGLIDTPGVRVAIDEVLKTAAMIGAAEERKHGLATIRDYTTPNTIQMERRITDKSVFAVLGFPEAGAELKPSKSSAKGRKR